MRRGDAWVSPRHVVSTDMAPARIGSETVNRGKRRATDRHGLSIPDGSWPLARAAEGPLERVRRFVNTVNRENGADRLHQAVDLRCWLDNEGWAVTGRVDSAAVHRTHRLRGALHAMAVANQSGASPSRELADFAREVPVVLTFGEVPSVQPQRGGIDVFFAKVLGIVFASMLDESWLRLKACANPHCQWVIYDRSKNRSVIWCADEACGNRARSRAHRLRQARDSAATI